MTMNEVTLDTLAERINATVVGDGTVRIVGCASIEHAGPDEVAFVANRKYARYLASTRAAAVIVGAEVEAPDTLTRLVAKDPYFAFRQAMVVLHGFRQHPRPMDAPDQGTHSPLAQIHPEAKVHPAAVVHPFVVIEAGVQVGPRTVLYPGVYVGENSSIGEDCILYPNVVIYDRCRLGDRVTLHSCCVIGQDGFGYATHQGAHHKIPQHGVVVIGDDVELGAGCAIERAAMGETIIGKGTKFADLISIGHGTTIGEHCLFVSLVGVSGSVDIGNYVVLGGQVGVVGHLSIGDGVQAAGKTAIASDVAPGTKVGGVPAVEFNTAKRNALASMQLAETTRKVRELEKRLAELESRGPK